jgi:MFS family permease
MLASWPLGIWLGLATLATVAAATTWRVAILVATLLAALAFGLILFGYREPAAERGRASTAQRWWTIRGREAALTSMVGLAWATLNGGFMLFLSFGPKLLLERGAIPVDANLAIGWASLLSIFTAPLGGLLLDRVRRRDPVIVAGLVGCGAGCAALALGGPAALWSILVGLLVAPVAGVVALSGEVLSPPSRSTGFGVFYTIFYAGMGLAPVVAGYLVDRHGGSAALWLAAVLWLSALPALAIVRVLQRRWATAGAS